MFGGNLAVGWPAALVAKHYMPGFEDRLRTAVRISDSFFEALDRHPAYAVERIANGTNLTRVRVTGRDAATIRQRLGDKKILLPGPSATGIFTLAVNETWNRATAADLVSAFEQSAT